MEIQISTKEMHRARANHRARITESARIPDQRGSDVDQSLARNGRVVVELEAPKGAGGGILEFKDCILIFRGYA